ncbi:adenylate/guanylate cyclase domain-containing protein [Aeromicrobium sp. CTD01-1L150]|uniref:adenylate/guanylate cyclase domain-containing protein n=1 Tax=Aeromicrobium sp. CTD01-1L150 TaxID=3341830 RepID=UPI0035C044FF
MSTLELVLIAVVALWSAALVVTTTLWLVTRRRVLTLRRRLDQLRRPSPRRRRLVPTPTQAVRGAVGTAIMVKDHGIGGVLRGSIGELAGWADVERPDLVRLAALDGTVTILFSDIEDSTTLNHDLGDRAWVQLLTKHDRIITHAVTEHGGHVVKTQGDGFMVAFGSPAEAVRAAVDIQRGIAGVRPGSRLASVNVRIGAHRGSAVHRDNDLFGRNVAHAARVASQADGGEILISDSVLEQLDAEEFDVLESRAVTLKGIPGSHEVHSIEWTD